MRSVDIIQKKRDGKPMSSEEIHEWIQAYSAGHIPDYQMSAWSMAVFFQGMNTEEVSALTLAMAESGDQVDLSGIQGVKVDKHSTGGVGDKTTLILAPLVSSAGVPVAKMSGRGLGHTGGTIDKLESIQGFQTERTQKQFVEQVNQIGVSIIGQSNDLAPADKKLYALRDVTGTVESIPLIASSIMSKKIAAGANAIVLDVKTGSGAFMKTIDRSIELANTMVNIGTKVGRQTAAIISDMEQPLGFAIGNALEVEEAIMTLRGEGPQDLTELCLTLGAHMVVLGEKASNVEDAKQLLRQHLQNGLALEKFKELVFAQGGNVEMIDRPELLPKAALTIDVKSNQAGYIAAIQAESLGLAAMKLGAGRATKQDIIDHAVGITLVKKVGDQVDKDDTIARIHVRQQDSNVDHIMQEIVSAYTIQEHFVEARPLLFAVVTKDGVTKYE